MSVIRLGVLESSVLVSRPVFTSLGLETLKSRSWSWSWDSDAFKQLHPLLKSSVCLSPLLLWNGYLATVVC